MNLSIIYGDRVCPSEPKSKKIPQVKYFTRVSIKSMPLTEAQGALILSLQPSQGGNGDALKVIIASQGQYELCSVLYVFSTRTFSSMHVQVIND